MGLSIENKAAAYIRVSTSKQEEYGTSKDSQLDSVKKFAIANGLDLDTNCHIFRDKKSASVVTNKVAKGIKSSADIYTSRPGLKSLLEAAGREEFKHVIIYSHDRFTRVFEEFLSLYLIFDRLKIKVHYSKAGEEFISKDNTINEFFEMMLSNLAELEANIIGSRVKLGQFTNTENNFWSGGYSPFGYNRITNSAVRRSILKKDEVNSPIVEEIFSLYSSGHTFNEIADKMNKNYGPSRPATKNDGMISKGKPTAFNKSWTKSCIASIINNETYTGRIVWDRRGGARNPVKHLKIAKAKDIKKENIIVSKNTWDELMRIKSAQTGKNAKCYSTPFILKEKLFCGICGDVMKCKNNGIGKTPKYYCYEKPLKEKGKDNRSELLLSKGDIELAVLKELYKILDNEVKSNSESLWNTYVSKTGNIKTNLAAQKNAIEMRIDEVDKLMKECENFIKNRDDFVLEKKSEEYSDDFFKSIQLYKTHLELNMNYLENQKKDILKRLHTEPISREKLTSIISDYLSKLTSIQNIDSTQKKLVYRRLRILIDKTVDKVIATPTKDGLSLNISLKFNHGDFGDFVFDEIPSSNI